MASTYITAGLLGLPFLIGLGSTENSDKTYWDWVLLGYTISFAIIIIWYIFTLVKIREAKRYFLKKIGKTGDESVSEKMESKLDYYWKSTVFSPAWLLESMILPQGPWNYIFSFIFHIFFIGYCTYNSVLYFTNNNKNAVTYSILTCLGLFGIFILFSIFFDYATITIGPILFNEKYKSREPQISLD